mmetsp:Transcript_41051/g.76347  ORF Transcript_41051/g.76347 Transcript_41051/m.76347 type:complete len:297 (-) Transcript_41051:114-1004(-)
MTLYYITFAWLVLSSLGIDSFARAIIEAGPGELLGVTSADGRVFIRDEKGTSAKQTGSQHRAMPNFAKALEDQPAAANPLLATVQPATTVTTAMATVMATVSPTFGPLGPFSLPRPVGQGPASNTAAAAAASAGSSASSGSTAAGGSSSILARPTLVPQQQNPARRTKTAKLGKQAKTLQRNRTTKASKSLKAKLAVGEGSPAKLAKRSDGEVNDTDGNSSESGKASEAKPDSEDKKKAKSKPPSPPPPPPPPSQGWISWIFANWFYLAFFFGTLMPACMGLMAWMPMVMRMMGRG